MPSTPDPLQKEVFHALDLMASPFTSARPLRGGVGCGPSCLQFGFAIDTKHVKTQVLVENGGTVMIGGIYETSEQEDEYKVPFFGDIPVLGYLFKNSRTAQAKQELLVFITPKMLDHSAVAR